MQNKISQYAYDGVNEMKYDVKESNDTYNECIIDPNNDRRMIICDSPNKHDGIIRCIGSIECQYKLGETRELVHGTGTAIHVDKQNNVYVVTAAHNILAVEKQCNLCKTKTIKTTCINPKCNHYQKIKTKETGNLIEPTHVYFDRRENVIEDKLGKINQRYTIDGIKEFPKEYRNFPSAQSGYDICVLSFECRDQHGIDLYRSHCSKIRLIYDESFGGDKYQLYIYGYPGSTREKKNKSVYYDLKGMGTSNTGEHQFEITKNKCDKLYIINKGIDTTAGQSGSCVYSYQGKDVSQYLIYGIHTGGSENKRANFGTFLDIETIEWTVKNLKNVTSNKFIVSHYGRHYALILGRNQQSQKNDEINEETKLNKPTVESDGVTKVKRKQCILLSIILFLLLIVILMGSNMIWYSECGQLLDSNIADESCVDWQEQIINQNKLMETKENEFKTAMKENEQLLNKLSETKTQNHLLKEENDKYKNEQFDSSQQFAYDISLILNGDTNSNTVHTIQSTLTRVETMKNNFEGTVKTLNDIALLFFKPVNTAKLLKKKDRIFEKVERVANDIRQIRQLFDFEMNKNLEIVNNTRSIQIMKFTHKTKIYSISSKEYFIGPEKLPQHKAAAYCKSKGSNLASIHSDIAFKRVRELCRRAVGKVDVTNLDGCWIGVNDIDQKGIFRNVDDTQIQYGFNADGTATKGIRPWAVGEPNDDHGGEHCVHLYTSTNYYYNDQDCNHALLPICEVKNLDPKIEIYALYSHRRSKYFSYQYDAKCREIYSKTDSLLRFINANDKHDALYYYYYIQNVYKDKKINYWLGYEKDPSYRGQYRVQFYQQKSKRAVWKFYKVANYDGSLMHMFKIKGEYPENVLKGEGWLYSFPENKGSWSCLTKFADAFLYSLHPIT